MATHPIYFVIVTAVAISTSYLICKLDRYPTALGRFLSIDGLRGYCALFAFVCHACCWYFKLQTGEWKVPPSNLYVHLGQTSIMFLFMVTGLLFFTKILDSTRQHPLDWLRLFVSRLLRLGPLYLFVVLILGLLVGFSTGWQLRQSLTQLLVQTGSWLLFTIPGAPDINGVDETWLMVAGATWTLPYEWLFYLLLPLIAALLLKPTRLIYLMLSAAAIGWACINSIESLVFLGLAGGMASAVLARSPSYRRMAVTPLGSFVFLSSVVWVVHAYPTAFGVVQLIWLTLAFSIVAAGNSLFGILTWVASRKLGEISYGVYLLHGLLLYGLFGVSMTQSQGASLSPTSYWALVSLMCACLVAFAAVAYHWIEAPVLRKTNAVTAALRRRRASLFG